MRIAMVTPGFSASDEDWCIPALQDLARRLGERHQVRVFTTTYPHRRSDYQVKGIPVSSFGNGRSGRLEHAKRMWRTAAAIEAAHRDDPFDVLHGFWADHGGIVTAWAARRLAVSNIVTVMGGELSYERLIGYGKSRRPIFGRMARFGARHADALVVNTGFHADRIRTESPALVSRVVPFGIDTKLCSPRGQAQSLGGQVAVLCVGSLAPVKGHSVVLQALATALAQLRGLHLHIVGEGELESTLRRQAGQLGIAHAVSFHGHIEHDLLAQYYRGSSFCVLGSYFESHGMVVPEAAACGRVTIGSAVGSMPDICPAEVLSQPGDVAALAANFVQVGSDTERRSQLGQMAREKVRNGFTLEQSVHSYEEVYRSCMI